MRVDGNTIKISPPHAARNTQPGGVEVVILDENLSRVPGPVSVTWTYVTTSTDSTLLRQQCSEIGAWVGVFTLPGNWHSVGVRWEDQGLSEVETNESYRRPAAPVNTGPPGTLTVAQPTTVEDAGIEQPAAEWSCSWGRGRSRYPHHLRGPCVLGARAAERRGARDRHCGLLIGAAHQRRRRHHRGRRRPLHHHRESPSGQSAHGQGGRLAARRLRRERRGYDHG